MREFFSSGGKEEPLETPGPKKLLCWSPELSWNHNRTNLLPRIISGLTDPGVLNWVGQQLCEELMYKRRPTLLRNSTNLLATHTSHSAYVWETRGSQTGFSWYNDHGHKLEQRFAGPLKTLKELNCSAPAAPRGPLSHSLQVLL